MSRRRGQFLGGDRVLSQALLWQKVQRGGGASGGARGGGGEPCWHMKQQRAALQKGRVCVCVCVWLLAADDDASMRASCLDLAHRDFRIPVSPSVANSESPTTFETLRLACKCSEKISGVSRVKPALRCRCRLHFRAPAFFLSPYPNQQILAGSP